MVAWRFYGVDMGRQIRRGGWLTDPQAHPHHKYAIACHPRLACEVVKVLAIEDHSTHSTHTLHSLPNSRTSFTPSHPQDRRRQHLHTTTTSNFNLHPHRSAKRGTPHSTTDNRQDNRIWWGVWTRLDIRETPYPVLTSRYCTKLLHKYSVCFPGLLGMMIAMLSQNTRNIYIYIYIYIYIIQ